MSKIEDIVVLIDCFQGKFFAGQFEDMNLAFMQLTDKIAQFLAESGPNTAEALLPILRQLVEAFGNQDYLLVADLLEYELKNFIR